MADRSIRYIKSGATRRRPFLLWAGFIQPHPPFDVPGSWAHNYDKKVPAHTSTITPLSRLAVENQCIAKLSDEESINRMRELYSCSVSFMDYHVGRILKTLAETGRFSAEEMADMLERAGKQGNDSSEIKGDSNQWKKKI